MRRLLHVGCGLKRRDGTTRGFAGAGWTETRLDVASDVRPDIVGSITDMSMIPSGSFDGVYSSHVLEHLFAHDVITALQECRRVLSPRGVMVLTCPDMQAAAKEIAEGRLLEPMYQSEAGPVAAIDMVFGLRWAIKDGHVHMAHRSGFTLPVLGGLLSGVGFGQVMVTSRGHPFYDLWAVAANWQATEDEMRELAGAHFPV
ncbi:class I SAM-dependent methyltransferase [Niveispirillum fermenti]|uniref:class I SAM-dependent methyltransferase n=1 Tax=Niveispirillum fermenti TaxID=1233113 RepID=UPI003A86A585